MAASSNGINFAFIAETMGTVLTNAEATLNAKIAGLGPNPTQTDLLDMQVGLQKWSMMIQLQSTINKELGDVLKSIVQKSG
ncbi:EscF/YscF/HrpA family type III secretion system needle major subunit [Ottowia thiooxydans]|uniref:Type III secretion protein F n=1 Tax=Ottowia thiooxydans TaxID=219182 RepID=A0ABV2QH21_9BURK